MPDTGVVVPRMMPDEEEILQVLRDAQGFATAAEVFDQLRVGREKQLPSAVGLNIEAEIKGIERAEHWLKRLRAYGCLETFVVGMRSRSLLLQFTPLPLVKARETLGTFKTRELGEFLLRMESFRCLVLVDGEERGSGILVGPNSVLTAWHVIATGEPGALTPDSREPRSKLPKIQVVLADGRKIGVARLTFSSPCADVEWPPGSGRPPISDAEADDRHDVALLHLYKPAGIHLGYASLASPAYLFEGPLGVMLVGYPEGNWRGVEFARLQRLEHLSARWGATVTDNQPGSSGGGYFDKNFSLVGIHQGRWQDYGRLIPLVRFYKQIHEVIAADTIPRLLWSLDGSADSTLIIARDRLFIGYHAAMNARSRARGLWICRLNPALDVAGLPFSYQILSSLVARSPGIRLMRVSFDTIVHDLPAEIACRASQAGLNLEAPAETRGVGTNQTEPEARVADRARRIAEALNAAAYAQKITLWVFFDHPAVVFGDEPRWALAAFVEQALKLDNLRIALAGFELVQMPCLRFYDPEDAEGTGAPGLMVDYLGDLDAGDVRRFITFATNDLRRPVCEDCVEDWTFDALENLNPVNGRYDTLVRSTIAERLKVHLQRLCRRRAPK